MWQPISPANVASESPWGAGEQGRTQQGVMTPTCGLLGGGHGRGPSHSHLSATRPRPSPCVSGASQAADPPPVPRVCMGALQGGRLGQPKIPTGFYSRILWELLFLGLEPWVREPLCWARPLVSSGGGSWCSAVMRVLDQPALRLHPPTLLDVAFSLCP